MDANEGRESRTDEHPPPVGTIAIATLATAVKLGKLPDWKEESRLQKLEKEND